MKSKQLLTLVIVAAILVVLAKWSSNRGKPAPGAARIGDKVLPGLVDKVNDVSTIAVKSTAGTAVVSRVDGTWRVPGRFGYRADFNKISDALRNLADLKIAQVMRVTPAQLAELHLLPDNATNAEARATVVELKAGNGSTVASLRIGKEHSRPSPAGAPPGMGGYPDGKFVAMDDARVYVVAEMLSDLAAADRDWLDQEFLNVSSADIASIEVTGGTNGSVRLDRPAAGGDLTLKEIPAGKEVDSGKLSRLTGALGYLRFEDIADPSLAPAATGLDKPAVYKATTTKGTVYTVKVGGSPANETRRYTSVSVAFAAPPSPPVSATDTNAAAAAQAKLEENRKNEEEAKALNDKLSPWIYLLGDYPAGSLLTPAAELLKDKSTATNAPPQDAAAPASEPN